MSKNKEEQKELFYSFSQELVSINSYIESFYRDIYPLTDDKIREMIEYSHISQGKRCRALLCILFGKIFSLEEASILPFAVAIEMIHTYSLIHDDLPALDNDTMRRGKATQHVCYGEAQAILAGDALLTDAFYAMTLTQCSTERVIEAIQVMSKASGSHGMVAGQMLDMMGEKSKHSVEDIHRLKTGAIIQASCVVSAILAGIPREQREHVAEFGRIFGAMFQIIDDILDEVGVSAELGKTVGKDKSSGKRTYTTEYTLKYAKKQAHEYYQQAYAILDIIERMNPQQSDEQKASFEKIRNLVDNIYTNVE